MTLPLYDFGEQDKADKGTSQIGGPLPIYQDAISPPDAEPEKPSFFQSQLNLSKHILGLFQMADPKTNQEVVHSIKQNLEMSPQNAAIGMKVVEDFKNMFSKVTWQGTKDAISSAGSSLAADPLGTIANLPIGLMNMFVTNPVNVILGSDATQNELQAQSVEDGAREIKSLLGTGAGFLVGAGIGRALGKIALARSAASLGMDSKMAQAAIDGNLAPAVEGASTQQLVAGLNSPPTALGTLGKNIATGVIEGGGFGAAQSAITDANREDVAAQMFLNGVVFAPIGAATELLRFKAVDPLESVLRDKAKDIAYVRQTQASVDRSLDQSLNSAFALAQSDNIVEAIAQGNLKTNPKAITVVRDVSREHAIKLEKVEGITVSSYKRENGNFDIMIVNGKNEYFGNRIIPENPVGKLLGRKKDANGNLVPQVGDVVTRALNDGTVIRGRVVTFEGKGGKDNIIKLDEKGKPVTESSQMKELWVKIDDMTNLQREPELGYRQHTGKFDFNKQGASRSERLAKQHHKFDPDVWFVDPREIDKNVDFGKIYTVAQATRNEQNFLAGYFKANGNIPQIGTISQARELVGYNGQDFFVKSIDEQKGVATLVSPRKGSVGGIEVPLDEVRLRDAAITQFEPKDFYDGIYSKFKDQFGTKPFQSLVADIAQKHAIKDDAVRPLAIELANRFKDDLNYTPENLADVNTTLMKYDTDMMNHIEQIHEKLVTSANSNGAYIEDLGTGFQLRNIETNEVLGSFVTPQEGIDFINKSGQASGVDFDGASPIPTSLLGANQHPGIADPGTAKDLGEIVGRARSGPLDRLRGTVQGWVMAYPWLADMREFVHSVDELYGTQINEGYTRIQNASLKFEAQVKNLYHQYDPLMREIAHVFKDPNRMVLAARAAETMSAAEIEIGLFKARPLNTGEKNVAKFIADNGLDETKVLQYRTQLGKVKALIKAEQDSKIIGESELTKQAASPEALKAISDSYKKARAEIAKQYQYLIDDIEKKFGMTKEEMELYNKFESIASGNLHEASIYGAVRLGRALKDPFNHGLSREDFFKKYNFNDTEKALIAKRDKAMDELGDVFQIDDLRRINNYMNHMHRMGTEARPDDIIRFGAHLDNPGAARFMSDMYRTGEVTDFNHDMVEAIRGYIRGGSKAQLLFPEIHGKGLDGTAGGAKHQFEAQLKKLPENIQEQVARRLREYVESVSGRQPIPDAIVKEGVIRTLDKLGLNSTSKPLDVSNKTASLLNTINAAYTGGRPYQGLRDITDIAAKYYIKYGGPRARKMLALSVRDLDISNLIDKGIIRGVDKNSFVQPVESSVYGKMSGRKQKFEDALFKMTLQDKIFARAQAAAYYESLGHSREIFNNVIDKKMTLDDAVTALSLRQFENNVTTNVGNLLESHGSEAAAQYYAKETVRSTIGLFGHGEQPAGWNTKVGRVLGQYGVYPISTRRFLMDVTTRGTPNEIAHAVGRWSASQGALLTVGSALGFNMGRWMMTPASLIFTGGPLTQFMNNFGQVISSLPGDDSKQRIAYNNFKQAFPSLHDPRSMFLPGSYAAYDMLQGYQLLADHGDAHGFAAFMGIPVNKDPNYIQQGSLSAPYMMEQFSKDLINKNSP